MEEQDEAPSMDSSLKHRIWVNAVGIELNPQKRRDGAYFWTYRFARAFKRGDEWEYSDSFSSHNDADLNEAIVEMIRFREANEATQWVNAKMADSNHSNAA